MLEAINVRSVFGERFASRPIPVASDYEIEIARADTDLESTPRAFQGVILPFLGAISLSVLFVSGLIYFREALTSIGNWGYLSVFFVELANSSTVFVPTPGQAFTFSMGHTLNPLYLGAIGGIGSAIGEFTGYALGARTGNRIKCGRLFRRSVSVPACNYPRPVRDRGSVGRRGTLLQDTVFPLRLLGQDAKGHGIRPRRIL